MSHSSDRITYCVVDIWRARPGSRRELEHMLPAFATQFRALPGIVSVDFTQLEDDPNRFLSVFRYESVEARERFVATNEFRESHERLNSLWDLDSPVYRGRPIEKEWHRWACLPRPG